MSHETPQPGDVAGPGPEAGGSAVDCVVEYVLFIRDDGYTVVRAEVISGGSGGEPGSLIAVGDRLAGVRPGETLRLVGDWEQHRRHGARFAVRSCERLAPASVRAIRLFLASGLVRGIGPLLAQAITDRFGAATLDVIDHEPGRLAEVYGIGERRSRWITESWHT
jgi:exodeoxyribonuclease V alpha subunit